MGVNIDTTYKVVDGDTVEVTMSMAGIEQTQEFTYKVEGNKLYLTADGETQEFTRK
jgi:HSP20 family molecular chaperone IbpA